MNFNSIEQQRYSRHLMLKEIGPEGQAKLKSARVLVVGAGGLGCPVLQYLAAAGVGNIGIVDFDIVDASNLQRQVLFSEPDIGKNKAVCAAEKLMQQNPHIRVTAFENKLTVANIRSLFEEHDIIVDGSDNFPTRYLVSDGCALSHKPHVFGSLYKFGGQVAVFNCPQAAGMERTTYRTVFPQPPEPGSVADCSTTGILGSVAGIIGTIQATETIKLIIGMASSLTENLMLLDAMKMEFTKWRFPRLTTNQYGTPQTWEQLQESDYELFCNPVPKSHQITWEVFSTMNSLKTPGQILDVREPWEVEEAPFMDSINIPLAEVPARSSDLNPLIPIIVICDSGTRSRMAVKLLLERGFTDVNSLEGGIKAGKSTIR